jgi:archaeosine-15-forming tRNA-guanine transglycosylase
MTIADELSESGRKLRALEDEIVASRKDRVLASGQAQASQAAIAGAFNAAAERIEGIARKLNRSRGDDAPAG